MLTSTEEDYIKAIYKIAQYQGDKTVSTKNIALELGTSSASVTDMIQKLSDKQLLYYEKYYGVSLTKDGQSTVLKLLRKHRLWESFLHDTLGFSWDQVHEIAEQLEHVQSDELIDRLDRFLGNPKYDPHGDPIPNSNGSFTFRPQCTLAEVKEFHKELHITGVRKHDSGFLQYLSEQKLTPGKSIRLIAVNHFSKMHTIKTDDGSEVQLSMDIARDLLVKTI
ncbi:MAG TPA: metal-dependent transcriptional regulator [Saprospiraceae bacterium]|nr:metal-dependent transcriptional regulator [Saprospiraceae bacterium]